MSRRLLAVQVWRMHSVLPVLLAGLILTVSPAQGVDRTIGGAIYTDLANPLTTGLAGVTVTATGTDGTIGTYPATTAGAQGLWQMTIPEGTYIIAPCMTGKRFEHIVQGVSDGRGSIQIVVNQANLGPNQSIQFLASNGVGNPDAGQSTVTAAPTSLLADGLAESTITITLRDACGNLVASFPAAQIAVSATGTGNTITQPATATNASGVTTAKIKSTDAGDKTITVTITVSGNPIPITDTAVVTFNNAPSPTQSQVDVNPTSTVVGNQIVITVTVNDSAGSPVVGHPASQIRVSATGTGNTLTQPTANTDANGQTTATITSTVAEVKTISGTLNGVSITDTAQATFTPGPVSAGQSQVVASPTSAVANGTDAITITITLKDANGNPIPGVTPIVTATGTGNALSTPAATNASGQTTATITSTVVEQKTINVTANGVQLTSPAPVAFEARPQLRIQKSHAGDPVDPNSDVTYTASYRNSGIGDATGTVITEVLPAELTYKSGGTYTAATRTITWQVGTLAPSETNQTVTFTAQVPNLLGGGYVTNSNLTIDAANADPCTAPSHRTNITDTLGPQISGQVPDPNFMFAALSPMIQFHVTDRGGVDFGGDTVRIFINDDLVYNGSAENPTGQYNTTGAEQSVRGIVRRTGEPNDFTFTFIPSMRFAYEQVVNVRVEASDVAGNTTTEEYSFEIQQRSFGRNTKVNSDTGTIAQDNPATARTAEGDIAIVWDQTTAAGNGDIYVTVLPADANAFEPSVAVVTDPNDQRNPAVAIDDEDTGFVVWQGDDPNGHWDIFVSSTTTGTTWSAPVKVDVGDPNNTSDQTSPAIAFRPGNTLYVVYEDTRAGNKDIWLATSPDGTAWTETQITNDPAEQTQPAVAVDPNGVVFIIWTDARNAATAGTDIFGARSDTQPPWVNAPLINTATNQNQPAGAIADDAHLAWVDDVNDLLYAHTGSSSIQSILDDEPDARPALPALAAVSVPDANDRVFATWVDNRDFATLNSDIYFAEAASPFGVNIRVNDDNAAARQTKPAIGLDDADQPYIVWVDNRSGNDDIFYAGATVIESPFMIAPDPNDPNSLIVPDVPGLGVTIPTGALPPGIAASDITISEVTNPPEPPTGGLMVAYEFGPSGAQFDPPVTIRIPLDPNSTANTVYRYDPSTGAWTTEGIIGPATKVTVGGNSYLEVKVSHFSIFTAGAAGFFDDDDDGGGCALSPWSNANPIEFALPFLVCMAILLTIRVMDGQRRRSGTRN